MLPLKGRSAGDDNIVLNTMKIQFINSLRYFILVLVIFCASTKVWAQQNYKEELKEVESKLREGNFSEGLHILDQILEKNPDAADIYYAKSLINGQLGNYEIAVESASLAYEKSNNLFYAYHLLELYKSKKDYTNSIALLENLKKQHHHHEGLNRELMIMYASNQQVDNARKLYDELIQESHSDTLKLVMAEIYMNTNDLADAKKILSPMDGKTMIPDVYGYLGYLYNNEGKKKEAVAVVQRGIKRTNDKTLYLDLADMHRSSNKHTAMYNALELAFDDTKVPFWDKYKFLIGLLNDSNSAPDDKIQNLANTLEAQYPDVLEAKILKGEVLAKRGNVEEARSVFLQVVSSNPRHVNAWRLIILADLELGQTDEAIKHGQEGLKHNPNNSHLLYFTSLAYAGKSDYDNSRALLESALNYSENENNSIRSLIYGSLGDLYHELKMEDLSDVAYEEAIALDSTNVTALNNYAYYLAVRKKDLDKAAAYAKLSNELEPYSATFKDTYAWVLFQQGQYAEALRWIEGAVKLDKSSAIMFEHYGDILIKLKREKEAVVQWQKALELDTENKDNEDLAKLQQKIQERKYVE